MKTIDESSQNVAQKEIDCLIDCSMILDVQMKKENLTQALSLTQDIQKSIVSLQKIIKEKETNNQLKSIVSKLASIGVDSTIVSKYFDNKKS